MESQKWSVCSEDSCGGGMRSRDVTCEPREDVSVPPKEREKGCPGIMPDRQETCNNELCSDDICRQEIRHCCTTINKLDGYRNGVNCAYSIVNRNGCVNITIMTMALPENEDCSLDYIKFADARKESLTKKFCGSTTATQEPALTWNSYSGIVNITFHSDGKKTGKEDGYVLIYDFVACGVWHVSPWSQCPVTCGEGTKFRQVQCRSRATLTVEPDSYCRGPKPPTTEQCVGSQPCEDPALLTRFSKNYDKSWCSQIAGRTIDAQICQEFFNLYRQTNKFAGVPYSSQIKWQDFLTFSSSQDYTDLRKLLKFNKNELAEFGHQLQDFVLQCSFNDEMCDIPSDFIQTQNDEYGNCYTYNHGQDGARLKYTNGEIVGTGLKLTLYIEQDEYVPFYGQDAGVRVLIHQPGITPFPEDYGVTVPPGKKAGIAIRRDSYIMKGSPFLDCIDQRDYRSIYGKESYYTTAVCHKSRVNLYIKELCGCADTIWLEKSGTPPCNIRQEEQERCRQFVRFLYLRGILKNDCKQSCRRIDYSSTMSLSQWPSNKHMGGLIKTLRPTNSKVPEKIDADSARDNLLKLEVSYEVPNSRSTISSPRYTFDQLIADIGGLFGLYLGISLITVVEFIEFLYDMYCYFISWKRVDERRLKKNRGNKMYDLAPSHSPDEFGTRV
ncbi:acid-sensing ion channel 1-like [Ptychodera flava]|uniref:acid-sensing ion channel 1-like n=1 Tax=Ptychodera flava TaxID=63121 RepID=UPI00396A030C